MTDRALALAWSTDLERNEAERAATAVGGRLGDYCTWPVPFEQLRALEGVARDGTPLAPEDPVAWAQLQLDRQANAPAAAALRGRLDRFYAAWQRAELDYRNARRRSPAFAILDLPEGGVGLTSPSRRRPRLSDELKRKQRHRYKGAMANALEAFARKYVDPDHRRAGLLRPRWLEHRPECRVGLELGARCEGGAAGCARVRLPPAPRWRRSSRRRRKRDSITLAEWLIDRAAAARACQDVIGLRDQACGGVMVIPQSCHVRAEPDCESARQQRVVRTYRAAVEKMPADRARFLTLTKRNPPRDQLAQGLNELADAWEKLRRRAIWKGGRCRDRASCAMPPDPDKPGWKMPHPPVAGHLATIEQTYNPKARTWHPHLHVLLEGPYIDQGELSRAWLACTGDSNITWIESVREHARTGTDAAGNPFAGDIEAALRELLKYAAKPHPAFLDYDDPAVLAELLVALRGRHLVAAGGNLYGMGLEDPEAEADTVLVWPEGDGAERPYHAPRLCPLHDGPADWRVIPGTLRRVDCTPTPATGPPGKRRRRVYTWTAPPA